MFNTISDGIVITNTERVIVLANKELEGRSTVAIPDPSREMGVYFKPGSTDTLLFITDRIAKGAKRTSRIGLLTSDDEETTNLREARHHKIIYLTDKGVEVGDARWSPKGDKIAYVEGKGDLHVMNADGKKDKVLFKGYNSPSFSWAPDGNWIAYSVEDRNYNSDVWIMPADGGKAVNLSPHPDDD